MAAIAVRLLRLISIAICLIVVASFLVFAVQQTKGASNQQQEQLSSEGSNGKAGTAQTAPAHESSVHKTLDEASNEFTSPFAGIVSESESKWASHGIKLLLALLLYGFAIGYLLRILSIRV
jgi:hypothetical protein